MLAVASEFGSIFSRWRTWWLMASQDISLRYKRSVIGPFWLSIAMAVQVVGIGLLFSQIFDQPLGEFLLFVAAGFLVWGLVSGLINEACVILIEAEGNLRAVRISTPVLAARMVHRNLIIFLHNLIVIGALMLFLGMRPNDSLIAALGGLVVIGLVGFLAATILGPLCLRFRDVTQVVVSLMGIAFFITPIIWMPSQGRVSEAIVHANPLYHLIELVRAPLMGAWPTDLNWIVGLSCVALLVVPAIVSVAVSRGRIYFWL